MRNSKSKGLMLSLLIALGTFITHPPEAIATAAEAAKKARDTAAEAAKKAQDTAAWIDKLPPLSLGGYATLGLDSLDGKGRAGSGIEGTVGVSDSIAIMGFAESDDVQNSSVDRSGGGVRVIGKLGSRLRPFAGIGAAYDFEKRAPFVRPEFGGYLDFYKSKPVTLSFLGKWALDVDTKGNSSQRISGGFSLSLL